MGTRRSMAEKIIPKLVRDAIDRTITPNLLLRASGKGHVASNTGDERRKHVLACVAQLWQLKYPIRKLESLSPKHVRVLMAHWGDEGRPADFLHNRLSLLRTVCGWMGKRHVVGDLDDYFPPERTRRKTATEKNLSWKDNGVDVAAIVNIAKTVDKRLAVMITLQDQFGLRTRESIEFRPLNALDDEGKNILVYVGTKGAKPRLIPIETVEQREAYEWARRVASEGKIKRLRWPGCTEKQARTKFYHLVARRLGLTRAQWGVTAHGLRHGYAQRKYERETGYKSPIENPATNYGGPGAVPLTIPVLPQSGAAIKLVPPPGLTREMHNQACMAVSRAMGHERIDVTAAYYGTYGHGFRTVSPPTHMRGKLK